jgi:hypothetical protein
VCRQSEEPSFEKALEITGCEIIARTSLKRTSTDNRMEAVE